MERFELTPSVKRKVSTIDFKTILWSQEELGNILPECKLFFFNFFLNFLKFISILLNKTSKYYCTPDKTICLKQI